MELEQLRYILKIAEFGNITKAAEYFGLSQPALSRSLQRLEEEVGQPLFERQTRRMVLTESGELLVRRASQVLSIVDDTTNELLDDGKSGRLRIGSIPTIAPYFLPQLLKDFSECYPSARLIVQEDVTGNLLSRLSQGELDVAILALPIQAKHLNVIELFAEELLLVVAKGHPLERKKLIRVQDIESCPFVLLDEAHCLTDKVMSFCRQRSIQPVSVERATQLATIQELVALNHGVSMVPAMAQVHDHGDRRAYRSFSGHKPSRTIVAVWNPYRFESKLQQEFIRFIKQQKTHGT